MKHVREDHNKYVWAFDDSPTDLVFMQALNYGVHTKIHHVQGGSTSCYRLRREEHTSGRLRCGQWLDIRCFRATPSQAEADHPHRVVVAGVVQADGLRQWVSLEGSLAEYGSIHLGS